MEIKLNKIEPELLKDVDEKTKKNKVHKKEKIFIKKDLKKQGKRRYRYYRCKPKKIFVIEAEQELEGFPNEAHKGLFIDKRT